MSIPMVCQVRETASVAPMEPYWKTSVYKLLQGLHLIRKSKLIGVDKDFIHTFWEKDGKYFSWPLKALDKDGETVGNKCGQKASKVHKDKWPATWPPMNEIIGRTDLEARLRATGIEIAEPGSNNAPKGAALRTEPSLVSTLVAPVRKRPLSQVMLCELLDESTSETPMWVRRRTANSSSGTHCILNMSPPTTALTAEIETVAPEVLPVPVNPEAIVDPEVPLADPVDPEAIVDPEVPLAEPIDPEIIVNPEVPLAEPIDPEIIVNPEVPLAEPIDPEIIADPDFRYPENSIEPEIMNKSRYINLTNIVSQMSSNTSITFAEQRAFLLGAFSAKMGYAFPEGEDALKTAWNNVLKELRSY